VLKNGRKAFPLQYAYLYIVVFLVPSFIISFQRLWKQIKIKWQISQCRQIWKIYAHTKFSSKLCIRVKVTLWTPWTDKWTMSPRGLTVSCKSPPHIQACIDSGSPFGHALIQVPAFGHVLICIANRCILVFFLQMISRHCAIKWRHSVKILTDLESAHQGLSFEVPHDMVPSISKFDLKVHHFRPCR
jgi:hypothetical protein